MSAATLTFSDGVALMAGNPVDMRISGRAPLPPPPAIRQAATAQSRADLWLQLTGTTLPPAPAQPRRPNAVLPPTEAAVVREHASSYHLDASQALALATSLAHRVSAFHGPDPVAEESTLRTLCSVATASATLGGRVVLLASSNSMARALLSQLLAWGTTATLSVALCVSREFFGEFPEAALDATAEHIAAPEGTGALGPHSSRWALPHASGRLPSIVVLTFADYVARVLAVDGPSAATEAWAPYVTALIDPHSISTVLVCSASELWEGHLLVLCGAAGVGGPQSASLLNVSRLVLVGTGASDETVFGAAQRHPSVPVVSLSPPEHELTLLGMGLGAELEGTGPSGHFRTAQDQRLLLQQPQQALQPLLQQQPLPAPQPPLPPPPPPPPSASDTAATELLLLQTVAALAASYTPREAALFLFFSHVLRCCTARVGEATWISRLLRFTPLPHMVGRCASNGAMVLDAEDVESAIAGWNAALANAFRVVSVRMPGLGGSGGTQAPRDPRDAGSEVVSFIADCTGSEAGAAAVVALDAALHARVKDEFGSAAQRSLRESIEGLTSGSVETTVLWLLRGAGGAAVQQRDLVELLSPLCDRATREALRTSAYDCLLRRLGRGVSVTWGAGEAQDLFLVRLEDFPLAMESLRSSGGLQLPRCTGASEQVHGCLVDALQRFLQHYRSPSLSVADVERFIAESGALALMFRHAAMGLSDLLRIVAGEQQQQPQPQPPQQLRGAGAGVGHTAGVGEHSLHPQLVLQRSNKALLVTKPAPHSPVVGHHALPHAPSPLPSSSSSMYPASGASFNRLATPLPAAAAASPKPVLLRAPGAAAGAEVAAPGSGGGDASLQALVAATRVILLRVGSAGIRSNIIAQELRRTKRFLPQLGIISLGKLLMLAGAKKLDAHPPADPLYGLVGSALDYAPSPAAVASQQESAGSPLPYRAREQQQPALRQQEEAAAARSPAALHRSINVITSRAAGPTSAPEPRGGAHDAFPGAAGPAAAPAPTAAAAGATAPPSPSAALAAASGQEQPQRPGAPGAVPKPLLAACKRILDAAPADGICGSRIAELLRMDKTAGDMLLASGLKINALMKLVVGAAMIEKGPPQIFAWHAAARAASPATGAGAAGPMATRRPVITLSSDHHTAGAAGPASALSPIHVLTPHHHPGAAGGDPAHGGTPAPSPSNGRGSGGPLTGLPLLHSTVEGLLLEARHAGLNSSAIGVRLHNKETPELREAYLGSNYSVASLMKMVGAARMDSADPAQPQYFHPSFAPPAKAKAAVKAPPPAAAAAAAERAHPAVRVVTAAVAGAEGGAPRASAAPNPPPPSPIAPAHPSVPGLTASRHWSSVDPKHVPPPLLDAALKLMGSTSASGVTGSVVAEVLRADPTTRDLLKDAKMRVSDVMSAIGAVRHVNKHGGDPIYTRG